MVVREEVGLGGGLEWLVVVKVKVPAHPVALAIGLHVVLGESGVVGFLV